MTKKSTFLIVLLLIFMQVIFAQTYNRFITGKIVDNQKNPLPNINIKIKNQQVSAGTVSDINGNFKLLVHSAVVTIKVSAIGFESKDIKIEFAENTTVSVNIVLNDKTYELNEITVTPEKSLLDNNISKAKKRHNEIPGGTNLFELQNLPVQSSHTLKDAMRLVPGIHIQEFFGANDQPRLNIRGSGIQSNPQFRGVELLQDGISTNFSDGSFIIGLMEPRAANYIEVFRGANSLKYGTATLGGAVNLISKDGYTSSPLLIKLQGGSFKYMGGSISSGSVFGKNDYYTSISYNKADGFRNFNESDRLNAMLNIGRKFTKNLESRLYVTFTDLSFDVPGPLTQAQIDDDPKQNNPGINPPVSIGPNVIRDKPGRESQVFRIANRTYCSLSEKSTLSTGIYYQYADDTFTFPITSGVRHSKHNDFGFNFFYNYKTDKNKFVIGITGNTGNIERKYFTNMKGKKDINYADNKLTSNNISFIFEDIYKFTPKLSVVATMQVSYNERNNEDQFATPKLRPFAAFTPKGILKGVFKSENSSQDKNYTGFNPKLGFIYHFNETNRVYANVSRSYEPPTFDELINISGGNPNKSPGVFEAADLDDQTATTFEIGSKGKYNILNWDISIYHSRVKNEILTTTDIFGITGITRNSTDATIHRGMELGLGIEIFKNLFSANGDKLNFNTVYNYNDFYFNEGFYEDKQIAGIPKHYLFMNLEYKHPSGIFAAVNMETLPEKTPTDHQNTLFQKSYTLLGFRIGYNKNRFGIFIEGKNLTDEKYAASYVIRDVVKDPAPPVLSPENVTTFIPGTGRNIIAGISFNL